MGSLNIHQSKSSHHDRLGFHPDCPTCRQDRLFGALSPEPVYARRVPVLLAAGVLALSSVATASSVAAEPDSQHEGLSVPEQVGPSNPAPAPTAPPPGDSPDPGQPGEGLPSDELGQHSGGETTLPFDVGPVPGPPQDGAAGGTDEVEPLEAEPTEDPEGRLPLTDPNSPAPLEAEDGAVAPTEPAPLTPPSPPPAPPTGTGDPGEAIDEDPTGAPPEGPPTEQERKRNKGRRGAHDDGNPVERDQTPRVVNAPTPAPPPADSPAPQAVAQPASDSGTEPIAPPADVGRFHVVQPGESLWSIATALLGREASSAQIAREVQRLWELNEDRIGTGDPNLLPVGVKLRLR